MLLLRSCELAKTCKPRLTLPQATKLSLLPAHVFDPNNATGRAVLAHKSGLCPSIEVIIPFHKSKCVRWSCLSIPGQILRLYPRRHNCPLDPARTNWAWHPNAFSNESFGPPQE